MALVKIGNASFNTDEVAKMSFEQFSKLFKGKVIAPKMTLEQVFEAAGGKVRKPSQPVTPEEVKTDEPTEKKTRKKKQEAEESEDVPPQADEQ